MFSMHNFTSSNKPPTKLPLSEAAITFQSNPWQLNHVL